MANKRMFAKTVISTDTFVCMSLSAQALYFHFGINADDDGFIDNPKSIQRMIGSTDEDLKELLSNGYIIQVGYNLYLVKHWRLNNNKIEPKKYNGTVYKKEFANVILKNNVYELKNHNELTDSAPTVNELCTDGAPVGHGALTGRVPRLDKNRLDKSNIYMPQPTKENTEKKEKNIKHKYGAYKNILLSDDELEKLKSEFPDNYQSWIERVSSYVASTGKTYKNYLATIRNWAAKERPQQYQQPQQPPQVNTSDVFLLAEQKLLNNQRMEGDIIDDN